MKDLKTGLNSPDFSEAVQLHRQGEKDEQRAIIKALKRELEETLMVRDKALSFIVAQKEQEEFKQHIGLTCYPGYAEKVAASIREMLDLFCKQQEVNEKYNNAPTAWHNGTILPYSVVLYFSRLFASEDDYLRIMGDLCTIREHLANLFQYENTPLQGNTEHPVFKIASTLNEIVGALLTGKHTLITTPTKYGNIITLQPG